MASCVCWLLALDVLELWLPETDRCHLSIVEVSEDRDELDIVEDVLDVEGDFGMLRVRSW